MDAQFARWVTMIAAFGAGVGMLWGFFAYKEEPPNNVITFPNCDECAEYA
jgi:hypothetical protein